MIDIEHAIDQLPHQASASIIAQWAIAEQLKRIADYLEPQYESISTDKTEHQPMDKP